MVDTPSKLPSNKTTQRENKPALARMWPPFDSLRTEIDRLFDDFSFNRSHLPSRSSLLERFGAGDGPMIEPAFEVAAGDNAYVVTAELPGLDQKDVDVTVANGVLAIRGEKREEKEESKKDYFVSERRYGSFSRTFRLPEGVDEGKIEADMKQGLLTVTIPKSADAKQKERKVVVKG